MKKIRKKKEIKKAPKELKEKDEADKENVNKVNIYINIVNDYLTLYSWSEQNCCPNFNHISQISISKYGKFFSF